MHSKKDMEVKELEEMVLQLIESHKAMEREIGFLKDNLKAQNSLSKEMLKIHKIHRDMASKNSKQLGRIEGLLKDRP
jgi:hypothetical protein